MKLGPGFESHSADAKNQILTLVHEMAKEMKEGLSGGDLTNARDTGDVINIPKGDIPAINMVKGAKLPYSTY